MTTLRRACERLLAVFRRDALDRDFDEEAQSHVALATEDYVQRGVPVAEAERLARMRFGSVDASRDAHRDARGLPWIEGLFLDLRLSLRGLRRDWAFVLAAVVILTIAFALNTSVFTIRQAMLVRGMPLVPASHRLVYIDAERVSDRGQLLHRDIEEWRAQAQAFTGLAVGMSGGAITFRDPEGRPTDTRLSLISANTFGVLRVQPTLGRDFMPSDEIPGAAPVAILSHHFWNTRLARRPDVIGAVVHVNDTAATVIGVMPEGFVNVYEQNLWMPLIDKPERTRVFGRLRDGVSRREAQTEIDTLTHRLQAADPATTRIVPSVMNYSQAHMSPDSPLIYGSLWAGAWLVLLIACANLANLTLVRTIGRSREFSIKLALGSGQRRAIRQLLVEHLLLAAIGSILSWGLTQWSVQAWATATASRYLTLDYTVGPGILLYLIVIALIAAGLSTVAPVIKIAQMNTSDALKGETRGASQGRGEKRAGALLVAGQVALAVVLLSGAGVLVRSLVAVVGADSGVRAPDGILVGSLKLPSVTYPSPDAQLRYFDRLETRLRALPGIEEMSVASSVPVNFGMWWPLEIEGRPLSPDDAQRIQFLSVGATYFQVTGVSALAGRAFNEGDRPTSLAVALVNQSFVSTFWPGEEPLGRRIRAIGPTGPVGEWRVVVGVVPNIMQGDAIRQRFPPVVYVPFRQAPATPAINSAGCCFRGGNILLRLTVPPAQVAPAIRAEIRQLDPDVTLEDVGTLKDSYIFDRDRMTIEYAELGKYAAVAPVLAGVALLLASIGVYVLIAYSVSQRTREIGVRIAIGAMARDISRMVVREGLRPVVVGLVVGLAASFAVNRLLQSQLVAVSPYDPLTMIAAPVALIVVAVAACRIPARRAMRVDPVVALRHE